MPTSATHAHTPSASTAHPAMLSNPMRQLLTGAASCRRRTSGLLSVESTTPATTTMDEVTVYELKVR